MQEEILNMLLKEEELSWKTILYDLVRNEQMDPWDINVSLLSQKYIEVIRTMQEHDLRISGKVLLAAAILLKLKSSHLVDNDISKLDALLHQGEEEESSDDLFSEADGSQQKLKEKYSLIPRHPQPRNRKVSINDLIDALQQAMVSKKRLLEKMRPVKFSVPAKIDILEVIEEMYQKITYYSNKNAQEKLSFDRLLPPRAGKQEKVYTFTPLLHLENDQKIEMTQEKAFAGIYVKLLKKSGRV